jgi:hypothetical protein
LGNSRAEKDTRRFNVGWKHYTGGSFRLVNAGRGGGPVVLDPYKTLPLSDLTKLATDKCFPLGVNITAGLNLDDMTTYMATYTGQDVELMNTTNSSSPTVGDFVEAIKTNPIRVYLHSKSLTEVRI